MTTILVAEDEIKIARLVKEYLTEAGFDVLSAANGPSAVGLARSERPDLIILDIGLPGMDGYDVTRAIRSLSSTPIIMLTARSDETDRIVGLELGADDYVVKPFSPREVVARVKAVLRRTTNDLVREVIEVGSLHIDVLRREVKVDGIGVDLTTSEFELLRILASQPGRVFTRGQLLEALRGISLDSYERAIDSHIKNLRKKIESDPRNPVTILTVYGTGYRLADA